MAYPILKNGKQYYPKHLKDYIVNDLGDEIYVIDKHGNEKYCDRKPLVGKFAKDRNGKERYAHNVEGDEIYPMLKKISVVMYVNGEPVLARKQSGDEIYPTDKKGNEFYVLQSDNTPVLVIDRNGQTIFARNRKKYELIPSSMIESVKQNATLDDLFTSTRDAMGNLVYKKSSLQEKNKDCIDYCINFCLEGCFCCLVDSAGIIIAILWLIGVLV